MNPCGTRGWLRSTTEPDPGHHALFVGLELEASASYLWISGLFLGFIISASAAFLWYMAKRSLKVISVDWKW